MIAVLGASAIFLAGLQAGINAPRDAFTKCLKAAAAKASDEKVGADGIEAYLRTNCGGQIDAFKAASVAFDVKNGLSRKSAASGADDMISGWLEGSVDNYKFRLEAEAPEPRQAATPATAAPATVTPATAPKTTDEPQR